MLLCEADSQYADIVERVLYNGFLSSTSLDGKKFFYENPLEIVPQLLHRETSLQEAQPSFAITQRVEVFGCSCCPPNITRLIASLGNLLYTYNDDTVYVHHYMENTAQFQFGGTNVRISQKTEYPIDGRIKLCASGLTGKRLALRIPGWCTDAKLTANGVPIAYTMETGYAVISIPQEGFEIDLDLPMPVMFIEASPLVREDTGKIAIQRGPVLYCAEAVDNGEALWALEVNVDYPNPRVEKASDWINTIVVQGRRKIPCKGKLYHPISMKEYFPQEIRLIPYYAFANREESEMAVWLRKY
jgi:DUF1680 family protein